MLHCNPGKTLSRIHMKNGVFLFYSEKGSNCLQREEPKVEAGSFEGSKKIFRFCLSLQEMFINWEKSFLFSRNINVWANHFPIRILFPATNLMSLVLYLPSIYIYLYIIYINFYFCFGGSTEDSMASIREEE